MQLLDTEMNRKIKRDPALAMDMKSNIFPANQSFEEIGEVLSISSRTAKRDWTMARAWLYRELS